MSNVLSLLLYRRNTQNRCSHKLEMDSSYTLCRNYFSNKDKNIISIIQICVTQFCINNRIILHFNVAAHSSPFILSKLRFCRSPSLFHIQHQSLQILSFGMVYINRMVGRLMKLVQDAHFATCLRCSCKHSSAEIIFCYHL